MYGDKDGKFLENKTHKELPWRKTRGNLLFYQSSNEIIPKKLIKEYYTKKFKVN